MKQRAGMCALFVLVVVGVVNQCDGIRDAKLPTVGRRMSGRRPEVRSRISGEA
jgi:hypothetical protein